MRQWIIRIGLCVAMAFALAGCAGKFPRYTGPEVTQIVVMKDARRMYLLHHSQVLESYDIDLGFAPVGHKSAEGDGRTPEGDYAIDRRNPNSSFYLSLGLDYPRPADIAAADAAGVDPGGDIFIHGRPNAFRGALPPDWTDGCIAVTNREMRQIYAMVRDGTPVRIAP